MVVINGSNAFVFIRGHVAKFIVLVVVACVAAINEASSGATNLGCCIGSLWFEMDFLARYHLLFWKSFASRRHS
jgi:hypothetical protein